MSIISYAQNFEDVMLWRALSHIPEGFYIDVGAWSPDGDSVTRLFSEKGWKGINIEPHPFYFEQLERKRPRDINLNLALGNHTGQVTMYFINESGLSTGLEAIAQQHSQSGWQSIEKEVALSTLAQVWDVHVPVGQTVHFLKIDVEGLEKAVLEGNDWQRNRPWILVIEATVPMTQIHNHEIWENILLQADYVHCYSDGLNRYYIAKERFSDLAPSFRYPPNVFDEFQLASTVGWKQKVHHLKEENLRLQVALSEASKTNQLHQSAECRACAAEQRYEAERQKSQALMNSTSWRLTAPLRIAGSSCPVKLRRFLRRSLKAIWWLVTPWRTPARLRFIRERDRSLNHTHPVSRKTTIKLRLFGVLRPVFTFALKKPALRRIGARLLKPFPKFRDKLQRVLISSGAPNGRFPDAVSHLSPAAKIILNRLTLRS